MQKTVSTSYLKKIARFENTLNDFLASDEFKECLVAHCCHTSKWHYDHQTLRVELFYNGTWIAPATHSWSEKGSCTVLLKQINAHTSYLQQLGETRLFEDILTASADEARAVARQLYDQQETEIKRRVLEHFAWMKNRGSLD